MTGGNLISVEMTEDEAKLFLKFREYQNDFLTLVNSGVFETRNGVAILHFDRDGTLQQVNKDVVVYKKGLPVVVAFPL